MTLSYFNENNPSPSHINSKTLHEALGDINLTEGEVKSLNWLRDCCEPSTVNNIVSAFKKAEQAKLMSQKPNTIAPEEVKPQNSISQEREDELHELFWAETNDDWTQEWRDNLTEAEKKLVDKWDVACDKGVATMCEKILELQKPRSAPQML